MGDPASHRISRVRQYSRSCRIGPLSLPLRDSHPLRSSVPATFGFRQRFDDGSAIPSRHLVQPHPSSGGSLVTLVWFGLFPVRSPLLRESSLFLGVREMFQFPRFPLRHCLSPWYHPGGLPHSDISGSLAASASPEHFVAWPRPSSACCAKASTMCPSVDHLVFCVFACCQACSWCAR